MKNKLNMAELRPWGNYVVIKEAENYKIKIIEVKKKGKLSYQYHNYRAETWIILEGHGEITLNGNLTSVSEGDTFIIPKGEKHRIENTGSENLKFIEVQTGTYFGEDDIVRLEDKYNRR